MAKTQDLDEAEVAAAVEEKRLQALQAAVPQWMQTKREIAAKNKRLADILATLEKRGVNKAAFKEAMKRANQETETLDLFDEEASALETLIRKITSGELAESDQKATQTATVAEERQEEAAKPKAAAKKAAKPKAASKKAAKEVGEDAEPGPISRAPAEDSTPDPNFRQKINKVAAEPGAEGLSADQIPMPGAGERPAANVTNLAERRQTGFVDRTERMSAKDARKLIGADDDVLGHG